MRLNHYDAIIIGSGIGGLVAGNYLTKAGLSTLIVERGEKVGGYCGSFDRDGYRFDEAVHYINSMGAHGTLRKICEELGVINRIRLVTVDPSDRIVMRGLEFRIYRDVGRTIALLSDVFGKAERPAIEKFFELITEFDLSRLYKRYEGWTFERFLSTNFRSEFLKTALGLLSTTMGLGPDKLSTIAALSYYKGSILDGGYHIIGGAQELSNALKEQFVEFGGRVTLNRSVVKIVIGPSGVRGVKLDDGEEVISDVVVSNCDATQTFENLVGKEFCGEEVLGKIKSLVPSLSTLVVYLGVETILKGQIPDCCNLWFFPGTKLVSSAMDIVKDSSKSGYVHIGLSSLHDRSMAPRECESVVVFSGASFMSREFWKGNRERLSEILVERACRVIPQLRGHIRTKIIGTPYTLYRYTLNRNGAYRGWETSPEQTKLNLVPQKTSIEGLYLTGHWVTLPSGNGGVSGVAQLGKNVANTVVRSISRKKTRLVRAK